LAGSDVNALDKNGATPLMEMGKSTPEMIDLLIKAGADVNLVANNGGSAPTYLCSKPDLFKALMKGNINNERLFEAFCLSASKEVLKLILDFK